MGVSIGPTNPDIDFILEGGEAFIQRMKAFEAAAKQAQEAAKLLADAKAEAATILDAAHRQLAENKRAAEQLATDREAAVKLQAVLTAKLMTIDEIARR
jgi:hypothetical protein